MHKKWTKDPLQEEKESEIAKQLECNTFPTSLIHGAQDWDQQPKKNDVREVSNFLWYLPHGNRMGKQD